MKALGDLRSRPPNITGCLNGGYGRLEVMCHRCETRAGIPLDAIPRPRDTPIWKPEAALPIWKLEAALKCQSCKKARYAPPVYLIKLTQEREITPNTGASFPPNRCNAPP